MSTHSLLVYTHIPLFVFWLGADLGVYLTMYFVKDSRLSFETRATLIKLAFYIDLSPRITAALFLPVGVELIRSLGLYPVGAGLRWSAWIIGIAWAALHVGVIARKGTAFAKRLQKLNIGFEIVMGGVLAAIGVVSLISGTPIDADWLALKLLLYGLIFWVILGIDTRFQPFTMILAMGAAGSTPEKEAAVTRTTNITMAWALILYAFIAAIALLGTTKPF